MRVPFTFRAGVAATAIAFALAATQAPAATLYWDQMNDGTNWGSNSSVPQDDVVTFGYDYSADFIPEAPNTGGGDAATTGLKLEANVVAPTVAAFVTVYPTGQNFTGNHTLRFDAWMNYDVGGGSATEFMGGGVGYDGVTADVASGAQMIATSDGGSSNDWRAFKSDSSIPNQFFIPDADMVAGSHNASAPYHKNFLPSVLPPAGQVQLPGGSHPGSPGFQWVTWEIVSTSSPSGGVNNVRIDIIKPDLTRRRIVNIDCNDTADGSLGCTNEGNISLFYADFFTSLNPNPHLMFGLIDNVHVTDTPEPASLALMGIGGLLLAKRRRRA